jgi:hypothetical protein
LELAIARFVAKSRKIEKSNVSNDFGLGGVMVSYVCGVNTLFINQKNQGYRLSVLLMIFRCKFNLTFCMSIALKIHQFFTINLWIEFQSSRVSISTLIIKIFAFYLIMLYIVQHTTGDTHEKFW